MEISFTQYYNSELESEKFHCNVTHWCAVSYLRVKGQRPDTTVELTTLLTFTTRRI